MDIKPQTQLLDVWPGKLGVTPVVRALPIKSLPGLPSTLEVADAAHELLAQRIQVPEGDEPQLEDVGGERDNVQGLVLAVGEINDGHPPVLGVGGDLELLAVVACVGAGTDFLYTFNGDCTRGCQTFAKK